MACSTGASSGTPLFSIPSFKRAIILSMALVAVEKTAWIIEPTVFGWVIDDLIGAAAAHLRLTRACIDSLAAWVAVFGLNSMAGVARRILETRFFHSIFAHIAREEAARGQAIGEAPAKTVARVELSREMVTFFQKRLPDVVEEAFDIVGTVVALAFFDWRLSLTCLFIIAPLYLMNRIYKARVAALQAQLHDSREDVFDHFSAKGPDEIHGLYCRQARLQEKVARWNAANFGLLRFVLLFIFLAVLYISIDLDSFTTGKIYSIVAYIWTFIGSTEYIPDLMESWTSLKDIARRLRTASE